MFTDGFEKEASWRALATGGMMAGATLTGANVGGLVGHDAGIAQRDHALSQHAHEAVDSKKLFKKNKDFVNKNKLTHFQDKKMGMNASHNPTSSGIHTGEKTHPSYFARAMGEAETGHRSSSPKRADNTLGNLTGKSLSEAEKSWSNAKGHVNPKIRDADLAPFRAAKKGARTGAAAGAGIGGLGGLASLFNRRATKSILRRSAMRKG